jgi:hypothetical protein
VRFAAALLLAACAQAAPPPAVVRGSLVECEAGELSIRADNHQVYRFTFDAKTWFERERKRIPAETLQAGDLVEVVSDTAPGSAVRYARTVHVVEQRPAPRPLRSLARSRAMRSSLDHIMPPGNLTFTGVVSRVGGGRMVLRTRREGSQTILLREDTRYLENGVQVAASALALNLRVFVRASKNFEGDVEAYQVVWGEILDPAAGR